MQDKTSTETERKRETVKKTDVVSAGGLATGAVVGIASAAFVLGLVVATVALLCILRYVGVCVCVTFCLNIINNNKQF